MSPLPPPAPLDLPRLVMRRAGLVASACLLLALLLGLWRVQHDTRAELEDALVSARLSEQLSTLSLYDDEQALQRLRGLQATPAARHWSLHVVDAQGGRLVMPQPLPAPSPVLGLLLGLNRQLFPPPPSRDLRWSLPRPDGRAWLVTLTISPEREQREALGNWLDMFGMLLLACAGTLVAMQLNLRRALRPLTALLQAIAGLEQGQHLAVQRLPDMPVRELEAIAEALRHLAGALEEAQSARRVLARQIFSLQEDERSRLARELHDEYGQRLTALRADAAWLMRQLEGQPALREVVGGMGEQCRRIHQDIRQLLTELRPLGPLAFQQGEDETAARLFELLGSLVASWAARPAPALRASLQAHCLEPGGRRREWRVDEAAGLALPRGLVLALYRMSQEALTNVARHAQAQRVRLSLDLELASASPGLPARPCALGWSVEDDGQGLGDPAVAVRQGTGLASLQERVWALGGSFSMGPGPEGRGWRLQARLPLLPSEPDSEPPTAAADDEPPAVPEASLPSTLLPTWP